MKLFLKGERCFGPKCPITKRPQSRNYPPGMHGQQRQRRPSEHGIQLREKQKIRRFYGLMEAQFRKHFDEAARQGGVTGENLLRILELRLDNVVFRLGFADSRRQARQLVRHGHFMVNGRKTNVPSFITRPGDVITVRPQSKSKEYFSILSEVLDGRQPPEWLNMNPVEISGTVITEPERDQMDIPPVNEQLVVEFYSR